jgi:hypothetical protein
MRIIALAVFLFSSAPVLAANCDTELKSTDTYKELSAKLKCLNDRISAIEGSGSTSQKAALRVSPTKATQVQEAGGIKMELEGCSTSGGSIACRIYITATVNDDIIYLWGQSQAVNQEGAVLPIYGYQGRGEKEVEHITTNISRKLIKDARTSAVVFFNLGPDNVTEQFSALQFKLGRGSQYSVTFRNVSVTQG